MAEFTRWHIAVGVVGIHDDPVPVRPKFALCFVSVGCMLRTPRSDGNCIWADSKTRFAMRSMSLTNLAIQLILTRKRSRIRDAGAGGDGGDHARDPTKTWRAEHRR